MTLRDILHWHDGKNNSGNALVKSRHFLGEDEDGADSAVPDSWDRFDPIASYGAGRPWAAFYPSVDIVQEDDKVIVSTELPGIAADDIEVELTKDVLIIKGEKKNEKRETTGDNHCYFERSYGAFERVVRLPAEVDQDKAEASFKKGVLTIDLMKTKDAIQNRRKLEIKS